MQRKSNENIQVFVRVRPTNTREVRSAEVTRAVPPKEILVKQIVDAKTKKFTFDKTFGPDSTQQEVYSSVVAPMIQEVIAGYNCTVFAYGQTGTGKTYTMVGEEQPELKSSWEDENMVGIIPRALSHLFDELRLLNLEFSMRVSYLELYNEELCDLLSTDDSAKIRIFDDSQKKGSVIVHGIEEIPVHSKSDVYRLLAKGQERRKTAATLMNAQSSRSHTVFSILVHIKENGTDGEEMLKIGKLNLVDLAGSENISKAGNEHGIRARESANINQSLLTLGRVITALVERARHIPYRESKLTRILQESLGGRTKTSIIATISPGHKDVEETLSTLEYAHRAKNIQNKPEVNQRLSKKTVIKEYTGEIDRLKRELMATRSKNGVYLPEDSYLEMTFKIESMTTELNDKLQYIKALKDDMSTKQQLFNEVSLNFVESKEQLQQIKSKYALKQIELNKTKYKLDTTTNKYHEKKFILEKHVETEEKLLQKATEIIEIAEVASTDSLKLQEALERRTYLENHNTTACDKLSSKLNNILSDFNSELDNLSERHLGDSNTILHEINLNMIENLKFSNSITAHLKQVSELNTESCTSLKSSIAAFEQKLTDGATTFAQDVDKQETIVETALDLYRHEFDNKIAAILNSLNEQMRTQNAFRCKIAELTIASRQQTCAFEMERSRFLEELQKQIVCELEGYAENINTNNTTNLQKITSVEEDVTNVEAVIKNCLENISQKLKSVKSSCTGITTTTEQLSTSKSMYNDRITEEIVNIKDHVAACSADKTIENELVDFETETIQINVQNNELINDSKQLNDAHLKLTSEQLTTYNLRLKEYSDKMMSDIKATNQTVVQELNTISTNIVSEPIDKAITLMDSENERLKLSNTLSNSLHNTLSSTVHEGITACKSGIRQCSNEIEVFRLNEMKSYTSTGQTPSKRDYSFGRELPTTSPHDRLRERYRLNYRNDSNISQPIFEISISNSPPPSDLSLMNCTGSTNVNSVDTLTLDFSTEKEIEAKDESSSNLRHSTALSEVNSSCGGNVTTKPRLTNELSLQHNSIIEDKENFNI